MIDRSRKTRMVTELPASGSDGSSPSVVLYVDGVVLILSGWCRCSYSSIFRAMVGPSTPNTRVRAS